MHIEQLRRHLAELQQEIARLDPGDGEALGHLRELAHSIGKDLEEERTLGDPATLVADIQRTVSGFEASHPNLTAILNNMLVVLGGMGV